MMGADTIVGILGVAGEGVRALLIAEASLKKLPGCKSEAELEALDQVETGILVAQTSLKEIACAALCNLPIDFQMKPGDENAFNQIVEDDERHMLAFEKFWGVW